ncbi:hypothetical protein NHX12_026428 [Muraenolepis orangiensis]|uniref:Pre-mRNA-splicing regulator WTAP n=1 Tax=Muraenolepis orangiensis TaxID=630683 RepID=A0A9Q0IN88_9TELE|nr:hypothetical protein NHX12_026428 [Muraenolepis orangiensis]
MTEEPLPKKVRLSESDMKTLTREELCVRWKQHETYLQVLEAKYADLSSNDVTGLKESEEKLKQQQQESARRENILVMRLATKEQEMQECTTQIQYLKQVQQPSAAQLRTSMVDPAINLFFLKMKGELEQTKDKLEQAQNELSAWKFTPDSQTGKKLMAKCRMLIQENQELGRQLSQGRIAQLEAELALQKKYSEELKSSQDELNDFIIQLDEEVEGMQSTILVLQQQLKETRQQLSAGPCNPAAAAGPSRSSPCASHSSAENSAQRPATPSDSLGKDYGGRVSNGPSNGNSSKRDTAATPSLYREVSSTEEDFPMSPAASSPGESEAKRPRLSEEEPAGSQAAGGGGGGGGGGRAGGFGSQLSAGYESVDSPTGSETSLTPHSNDTDSNADPQEDKATPVVKGGRTAGSRHAQNGLDSGTPKEYGKGRMPQPSAIRVTDMMKTMLQLDPNLSISPLAMDRAVPLVDEALFQTPKEYGKGRMPQPSAIRVTDMMKTMLQLDPNLSISPLAMDRAVPLVDGDFLSSESYRFLPECFLRGRILREEALFQTPKEYGKGRMPQPSAIRVTDMMKTMLQLDPNLSISPLAMDRAVPLVDASCAKATFSPPNRNASCPSASCGGGSFGKEYGKGRMPQPSAIRVTDMMKTMLQLDPNLSISPLAMDRAVPLVDGNLLSFESSRFLPKCFLRGRILREEALFQTPKEYGKGRTSAISITELMKTKRQLDPNESISPLALDRPVPLVQPSGTGLPDTCSVPLVQLSGTGRPDTCSVPLVQLSGTGRPDTCSVPLVQLSGTGRPDTCSVPLVQLSGTGRPDTCSNVSKANSSDDDCCASFIPPTSCTVSLETVEVQPTTGTKRTMKKKRFSNFMRMISCWPDDV